MGLVVWEGLVWQVLLVGEACLMGSINIPYSGYISFGQGFVFRSVTSRNENWKYVFLDKTGAVYWLYGKTEINLTKCSLSPKKN